jgi:soluble lytic murein transglycosylase
MDPSSINQTCHPAHRIFIGLGRIVTALCIVIWAVAEASTSNMETPVPSPILQETNDCLQPESCFTKALEDLKQGRGDDAQERLRLLREQFHETPWNLRAAFVLGKLALEARSDEAGELLKQALGLSQVRDYILFYQAGVQRQKSQWLQAVDLYDQLIADYPDSVLRPDVLYERAVVLMTSGDCVKARKGFDNYTSLYPNHSEVPGALLQQADCSLKIDDPVQAIKYLRRIWVQYPVDPAAQEAIETLFELVLRDITVPEPTLEERYHRAHKLFKAAQYEKALTEFLVLSENSENRYHDEATVMLAATQFRLKRYKEVRPLLEKFISESHQPEWQRKALYRLALTAFHLQDERLLLDVEKKMGDQFSKSHQRVHILIMKGHFYEDQGKPELAMQSYQQILSEFRDDHLAEDALWNIAWMAYKSARYQDANKAFSSYADLRKQGKNLGKFMYWTGRSAENLSQFSNAASAYKGVCGVSQRTYYCQMAKERLVRLSPALQAMAQSNEPSHLPLLQPMKVDDGLPENDSLNPLLKDPHYQTAIELMIMGFNKEAAGELDLLAGRYVTDKNALLVLSNHLYETGDYYRSLRILRSHFSNILENGSEAVPSSFWEHAFPLKMVHRIQNRALLPGSADPYVVAAIMREESALNPNAISNAGAMGLMQIMPYTGEWVAQQVGHEPFEPADLMNPDLNIQFGSWYLGYLAQQFNGNLILTIASYNAGPEAVTRWTRADLSSIDMHDEFIESIPYSETRAFTKRVLRTYTEYLGLAGFDPSQRFSRSILLP